MRFKERLFSLKQRKTEMSNTNHNTKTEILAPCGSYDILIAAIHAGADACYIGGNRFGARAYADNFDEQAVIQAISYAHIHGVKIYLTVNTLFKQNEISELYDYIKPYYEAGLDAVIVQDLGVFSYIRSVFPDLAVHCSTQMNITSVHGASFMAKQGAKRIVTAREMSLKEIEAIKQNVDIEVETFVHGAMCYSYSGQCLMSSLAGGRSGNRGRCAQPCRKCYDSHYSLSMKDLCSLNHIPMLLEAGIDSLKIEGRMKNAAYVASAVHAYKTIATDYQNNNLDEEKIKQLSFELANIYNRGGFTDGYFIRHNGADMISVARPNNQGVCIGTLIGIKAGTIKIKLTEDLFSQDVLELTGKHDEIIEITSGTSAGKGAVVTLNCPKTKLLKEGSLIYRTKCPAIIQNIEENYINHYDKQPLRLTLTAKIGEPLCLDVETTIRAHVYKAKVLGNIVEKCKQNQAVTDAIRKPLCQLGTTDYEVDAVEINCEEEAFVPAGSIKKLRREAIEELEKNIVTHSIRKPVANAYQSFPEKGLLSALEKDETVCIGVANFQHLQAVLDFENIASLNVRKISMPISVYSSVTEAMHTKMRQMNCKCYIELPHIISAADSPEQYLPNNEIGGIYIRNIDGLALAAKASNFKNMEILCDSGLYCYNKASFLFIRKAIDDSCDIHFVMPRELQINELQDIADNGLCMTLYEYQPVMLTANCIKKTSGYCDHKNRLHKIRDDKGNIFYEQAFCERCYNVIYNGVPFHIIDKCHADEFNKLHSGGYHIRFTIESGEDIMKVLTDYQHARNREAISVNQKTNGHLYRGVL